MLSAVRQLGFFLSWPAYLHAGLLNSSAGVLAERGLVFLTFLFSALFILAILKRHVNSLDRIDRLLLAMLIAVFPANFARISLATVQYSVSFFLFFAGVFLFSLYLEHRRPLLRIASPLLLFLSFSTNSFLFYYLVFGLFVAVAERSRLTGWKSALRTAASYADLILLPFLFWILKNSFFHPTGIYEGYNKVPSLAVIMSVPHWKHILARFASHFSGSFFAAFVTSFRSVFSRPDLGITFALLLSAWIPFLSAPRRSGTTSAPPGIQFSLSSIDLRLVITGVILYFTGTYPYLLVKKIGGMEDWASRHDLLLPIAAGVLLFAGIRIISVGFRPIYRGIAGVFIAAFLLFDFSVQLDYLRDWRKQESLILHFRSSPVVRNHSHFLFRDSTLNLNARDRTYRFYELTGMMRNAIGDDRRYAGLENSQPPASRLDEFHRYAHYNFKSYRPVPPEVLVEIMPGPAGFRSVLTDLNLLRLAWTDHTSYERRIGDILSVKFSRIIDAKTMRTAPFNDSGR
jgi:hypothetical protein